jgi:hypothetical protein
MHVLPQLLDGRDSPSLMRINEFVALHLFKCLDRLVWRRIERLAYRPLVWTYTTGSDNVALHQSSLIYCLFVLIQHHIILRNGGQCGSNPVEVKKKHPTN